MVDEPFAVDGRRNYKLEESDFIDAVSCVLL